MAELPREKRLRKELGLFGVYAIATGSTLSAGFFLLPGLAAEIAGPGIVLAYMVAVIPLIPAMFSVIELGTAMPRAGGVYYFLDRSLGPLFGMIGGIGTWLALVLKVAFALVGMGAYLAVFFPTLPVIPVAITIAAALTILNYLGAKKTGRVQGVLVSLLLTVLAAFLVKGSLEIEPANFRGFFDAGFSGIVATAGLIYISYVGVTNVASLSEEIRKPERNLPLGIILGLSTAVLVYGLGTAVMVGVLPLKTLVGSLTPVSDAAEVLFGPLGVALVSGAALVAFISVANAATMSASRYPLAMSRDHLLPRVFQVLSSRGTPASAILLTGGTIITILLTMDPAGIAKLASAFQLLLFAIVCLAVIVMRESHIPSFDPGYPSPLYPWMQVFGIASSLFVIAYMGWRPMAFIGGLIILGSLWYWFYARRQVIRTGAIYHIFERLGKLRYHGLDTELRGILKEKGLRDEDPFEDIVRRGLVMDLQESLEFEEVATRVAGWLATHVKHSPAVIKKQFMDGTRLGATPVTHGVALPHLRIEGLEHAQLAMVRSRPGVHITFQDPLGDHSEEREANLHAVFFLISPHDNPGQHLRILAEIAGRVDDETFASDWDAADDEHDIKEALLRGERYLTLLVRHGERSAEMIGRPVRDLTIPQGCLITWLRRGPEVLIPRGSTVIEEGDRLTVIGEPADIQKFARMFIDEV